MMFKDGFASECVVDTHTTRPPLPPRPSWGQQEQQQRRRRRRVGAAQTLLFLLVSAALCGVALEACFIYRLYRAETAASASASSSKLIAGDDVTPTTDPHPSKPAAHLTGGQDVVHGQQIMAWSVNTDPLLYEMGYRDRSLIIQREGYYFIYSKVFFEDSGIFHHCVDRRTSRFTGGSITLLQSRKYSPASSHTKSNSYLGGVFHLYKDDALQVKVSNTTKTERVKASDNVFGAYMI